MLYAIAHFLRDRMPWLWDLVDMLNSLLFTCRYGSKLKAFEFKTPHEGYRIVPMRDVQTERLVEFFARQPEEAYTFFKPHGFDAKSIKKLQRNKAFLGYVLLDNNLDVDDSLNTNGNLPAIAGYCFNRSFFHGKGFRGRMVGMDYRGRGLGTLMNKLLNEVGFGIGLRLFETVSKKNIASYRSAMSASKVKVIEEMENEELYLEILKD